MKLPKTLEGLTDKIVRLQRGRADLKRELESIEADIGELQDALCAGMLKAKVELVEGKLGSAEMRVGSRPTFVRDVNGKIDDAWSKLVPWMLKRKDLGVIERRLSVSGCRKLWAKRVKIPGVKEEQQTTVKVKEVK